MSVGIDVIDNEHKMLIEMVARLSDAIDNNDADEVVLEIFERLELYVKEHFSREEALMATLNYARLPPHKKQHQKFIKKISEFKTTLQENYSIAVAEEVNLFLFNWLTNHILIEDMRFSLPAYERGLSDYQARKLTGLKGFAIWLGSNIPLRQRIVLAALIPIGGILLLSFFILFSGYQQLGEMKSLLVKNKLLQTVNELTHHLQTERGLSLGYLAAENDYYFSKLVDQRHLSDHSIARFNDELQRSYAVTLGEGVLLPIEQARQQLLQLKQWREKVDKKVAVEGEVKQFYTVLIADLLDLPGTLLQLEVASNIALKMAAFTSVLRLRESGALQRDLGVEVIDAVHFSEEDHTVFARLSGEQSGINHLIEQLLTREQRDKFLALYQLEAAAVQSYQVQIYQAAADGRLTHLSSQRWFELMSNKLDKLKMIANQLAADVESRIHHKIQILTTRLSYYAFGLLVILALISCSSWLLSYSIISPVHRVTRAMKRLAQGYRDFHFFDKFAKDELGEMVDAYEACRINLLRADIAETVHSRRQDFNLKTKIREREHYRVLSSVDPLTGVLNRREFNKRAQYEIEMAWRYGRPFSLMMIDLDHFKKINDLYGHGGGDKVLKEFCNTCYRTIREIDILARVGGEEFAILMPETNARQAYELAERIRSAVSKLSIPVNGAEASVTVSIGIVEWSSAHQKEIGKVLTDADAALYQAKNSGRNRSVIYTPPRGEA